MAKRKKKNPAPSSPEPEFDPTSNANYVRSRGRRTPQWRWETVVGKIQTNSAELKLQPDLYQQAVKFHAQLNEVSTQQLARQYPNLYEAWYIHTQEEDLRWFLEPLIISNVDQEQIAKELDIELETVKFFEYLFFDVRGRSHLYHLAQTYGGYARGTLDKTNLDVTLKVIAYSGGAGVLRDYLAMGMSTQEAVDFYQATIRAQQLKNHMIAEAGRTVNRFTERHITEQAIERQKVEIAAQAAGLMMKNGQTDDLASTGVTGLAMTMAAFSLDLVKATPEIEPRASQNVLAALNTGNMNSVEPVTPPAASTEAPTDSAQEKSRGSDGP